MSTTTPNLKRAVSAVAPGEKQASDGKEADIMLTPPVLQHELRHVKVRLRERSLAFEELSQVNQENVTAIKQQTLYARKLEEAWTNLETSLQTLVPALPRPPPSPAMHKTTAEDGMNDRDASSYDNPVLSMLASRWSELSGRSLAEMKAEAKSLAKSHRTKDASAVSTAMQDVDEADVDAAAAGGGDEGDEEEDGKRATGKLDLTPELKHALEQRIAFTQNLLKSVLQQRPLPVSSGPDAAQIALLQSENLLLQQKLHSNSNELKLLHATVNEREQRVESLEDKTKMLQRKLERLKEDIESGRSAVGKGENGATSSSSTDGVAKSADGDVIMGTTEDGALPLEGANASKFVQAVSSLASIPDSRPMDAKELETFSAVKVMEPPKQITIPFVLQKLEELSDFKTLAERRLMELKSMKQHKTQLETDLSLSRMQTLEDEKAIRTTKVFQALYKSWEMENIERMRLGSQLLVLENQLNDEVRLRKQLQDEYNARMDHAAKQFDTSFTQATKELETLKSQLLALQYEKEEWLLNHQAEMEMGTFFTKLRQEILPDLERQLKDQSLTMAQWKQEKEAHTALKDSNNQGEAAFFAKTMRIWKQQELTLKAENEALKEQLSSSSSNTAAASSSSSSSPSSHSSLLVRISALEKENAALKKQLEDIQSSTATNDTAALQSELEQSKELSQVLGEELNTLSTSLEESQSLATRLTTNITDYTRTLDKFRQEKSLAAKQQLQMKHEVSTAKAKLDHMDQLLQAQTKVSKDAKAVVEQIQRENQRLKEELSTVQSSLQEERTGTSGSTKDKSENVEFKAKYHELLTVHSKCVETEKELRIENEHAVEGNRKVAEKFLLMKKRFKEMSRAAKASESSAAAGASSGNDAVVQSLKLKLNCRVCETRPKERVIVKCMHCFCAECVQANLDTRLRKCPQCGLKFGENDVKPLYL